MTLDGYNRFCGSLPHTHHVVQWDDAHVWKVGGPKGKVFAIASRWEGPSLDITFKASPLSFDLLKDQPGLRPAPYLASRGLLWIQRRTAETLDDAALKQYLRESHRLAAMNLPKWLQRELGLWRECGTPSRCSPPSPFRRIVAREEIDRQPCREQPRKH